MRNPHNFNLTLVRRSICLSLLPDQWNDDYLIVSLFQSPPAAQSMLLTDTGDQKVTTG